MMLAWKLTSQSVALWLNLRKQKHCPSRQLLLGDRTSGHRKILRITDKHNVSHLGPIPTAMKFAMTAHLQNFGAIADKKESESELDTAEAQCLIKAMERWCRSESRIKVMHKYV